MSFGLEVFNPAAQLILRVTDPALRVIYRRALGSPDAGSFSLPGFSAANADVYVISRQQGKRGMTGWMTQDTVNWGYESWWPTTFTSASDLIVVARK